jgi:hypothetical protein
LFVKGFARLFQGGQNQKSSVTGIWWREDGGGDEHMMLRCMIMSHYWLLRGRIIAHHALLGASGLGWKDDKKTTDGEPNHRSALRVSEDLRGSQMNEPAPGFDQEQLAWRDGGNPAT